MNDAPQVLTSALIWMLLGNSLRYIAVGSHALAPLAHTGWRLIWTKGRDYDSCARAFGNTLDAIYLRLVSALTTAASATLVYVGILLTGIGLAVGSMGNVLRYITFRPEALADHAQASSALAIIFIVVGMSCTIAAVSRRRTASLIMSAGFVLAGLGVGVVTVSWGMQ